MSPPTGWFRKCIAVNSVGYDWSDLAAAAAAVNLLTLTKTLHSMVVDQYLFLKMGSQMGSRGFKKPPQDLNIHILKIKMNTHIPDYLHAYLRVHISARVWFVYELTGALPFTAGYGQTRKDELLLSEDQPAQRFQSIFICLSIYLSTAPLNLWDLSSPTRDWTLALAMKPWSTNHWTTREFPQGILNKNRWGSVADRGGYLTAVWPKSHSCAKQCSGFSNVSLNISWMF